MQYYAQLVQPLLCPFEPAAQASVNLFQAFAGFSRRPKRLPGLLLPNTSLTEDMETLAPSDYLGVDMEEDEHVDAFAQKK